MFWTNIRFVRSSGGTHLPLNENTVQNPGCTALVTGATSGLGAEFARRLAPAADRLVLVGRREERLNVLSASLKNDFPRLKVDCFKADLSLFCERERLSSWVFSEKIPVNLLINNAGLGDLGSFESAQWERLAPVLEVNVTTLCHLTHLLLPMLQARKPSGILNVSSVAGFYPLPEMALYAATKAFVTSLSEALRMELSRDGITVTTLCPGPVPTEFFSVAGREGKAIRAMDRTHHSLIASPELVIREGLRGLERNRPVVIPNRFLAFLVQSSRLLPFPLVRKLISLGAGPKRP